jgi:hypothetical protein
VLEFVDQVEALRKRKSSSVGLKELEAKSLKELMAIVQRCEEKFGTDRWEDASTAWTRSPEKNREMQKNMITGGEGYRKF